jgi:hypothetical protein
MTEISVTTSEQGPPVIDLHVANGGAFPFDSRETVAYLVSFCETENFAAELDFAMFAVADGAEQTDVSSGSPEEGSETDWRVDRSSCFVEPNPPCLKVNIAAVVAVVLPSESVNGLIP